MTVLLAKPGLTARLADTAQDIARAQALRGRCFQSGAQDADDHDTACSHVVIENAEGAILSCFRMQRFTGARIASSYSATFYDLSALSSFDGPLVEMGRFCIDPAHARNPDVLRLAWGAMTAFVDAEGVKLLFGCSSFSGTDASRYLDSFALLRDKHLAPQSWLPRVKAPNVFRFAKMLRRAPDRRRAMQQMPPLLRTYLMMGGWVSDHAVVDREMNTLHVFTGVEIATIPPARKKVLRSVAGQVASVESH